MSETFVHQQLALVSFFGDSPFLVLVTSLLIFMYLRRLHYKNEALLFMLTHLSIPFSWFLKSMFQRTRPDSAATDWVFVFDQYSFPSSHVFFYTVFWGFIFYLTFKLKRINKYLLHFLRIVAAYFIIFVGISRVFLGMHWTVDVIAGYIFGGIFLALLIYVDKALTKN